MATTRRTILAVPLLAASSPARAQEAREGRPGEVRLGALFPLSGPLALLGDECLRGVEMAVEERAGEGLLGHPPRLQRADAAEPAAAIAEARRLVSQERVAILLGTYASHLAQAAIQASERLGVPYVELGAGHDSLTELGHRHLWRTCPRTSDFARASVDAALDVAAPLLGIPPASLRVALLHEDGMLGAGLAAAQAERLRLRGTSPAEEVAYPARATDLSAALARLRGAAPDLVLHAAHPADAALFFRQLREGGWRPRMIIGLGPGYSLPETARSAGPEFEGVMSFDLAPLRAAERAAPGAAHFSEAYKRRYGAEPRSGHSLAHYAGTRLLLDAVARAGTTERERLRAAMLATDLPEGATPAGWGARFDESGQNTRAHPWLLQWQEGRAVAVHPPEAAAAPPRPRMGPA